VVAAARLAGQPGHVAVHTVARARGRVAGLFAFVAHLCADFAEHALAQLAELFTDKSVIWSLSGFAALLPHQPELFADESELLANQPELFADIAVIFPDESELFTDQSELLAHQPELLSHEP
jgi:hypothetical protein